MCAKVPKMSMAIKTFDNSYLCYERLKQCVVPFFVRKEEWSRIFAMRVKVCTKKTSIYALQFCINRGFVPISL